MKGSTGEMVSKEQVSVAESEKDQKVGDSRPLTRKEAILHWLQLFVAHTSLLEECFTIAINDESRGGVSMRLDPYLEDTAIRFTDTVFGAINGEDDPDVGPQFKKIRKACAYLELLFGASRHATPAIRIEYFKLGKKMAGNAYDLLSDVLAELGYDGVKKSIAA